jgi:transglutaminase-like putative cysteine protease
MLIRFGFEIDIESPAPLPMLASLSTHSDIRGRFIGEDRVRSDPFVQVREYLDTYGNRISRFVAPAGRLKLWSDCAIEVDGAPDPVVPAAHQHAVDELPDGVLRYLVPSRYCDSDTLAAFAWGRFGDVPGGWPRVQAICDFVHAETTFGYKFGRPDKMASEVRLEKTGVCRDFAHLAIALCRAMNIPARYASGYLGDIGVPPAGAPDFCAWFEVFLDGRWSTFDARYNTPRIGRVLMVRGGDAADVAMLTSFGSYELKYFRVWTDEITDVGDDAAVLKLLETRPESEPLVYPSSARAA